jgi:PIN domain nuclease of toxin-antitoxin system
MISLTDVEILADTHTLVWALSSQGPSAQAARRLPTPRSWLPAIHKDPFDRILIAQCVVEKLTLVSKDAALAEYGVPVIW